MAETHDRVRHPFSNLRKNSNRFLTWVSDRVLPHPVMFYTAFTLPLVILPFSNTIKLTLSVISGSWIQWWALPALQHRQNELDAKAEAKADADHEALVYLATASDDHGVRLVTVERHLSDIKELLTFVRSQR